MVLGMGLLMPPLVIAARHSKATPRQDSPRQLDNPFWFVTDRRWGNVTGVILLAGLVFGLIAEGWQAPWRSLHGTFGWTVVVFVLVQIVSAWLRARTAAPLILLRVSGGRLNDCLVIISA